MDFSNYLRKLQNKHGVFVQDDLELPTQVSLDPHSVQALAQKFTLGGEVKIKPYLRARTKMVNTFAKSVGWDYVVQKVYP